MNKQTIVRLLATAMAAALGLAALIACDEPQAPEAPVDEQIADLEAPELPEDPEPQGIDEPQAAQPGAPPEGAIDQPQGMGGGMDLNQELSDDDVDQFADVISALKELDEEREDPQARMAAAETQEERQQIQNELMTDMQNAVEGAGLSFHEFIMMSQRLQQDEDFQERLEERVDLSDILGDPEAPPPAPR